jgi:O-antigen ligase
MKEDNVEYRLRAQAIGVDAALAHPFGVGFDGMRRATAGARLRVTTTDSVYVDTLLAAGFLGLFAYLVLIWLAWLEIGRSRHVTPSALSILRAGLAAFVLFGLSSVVPLSVFLAPLFFSMIGVAEYPNADAAR